MNTVTSSRATPVDQAEQLPDDARTALRSLILTLADTKRLLGIRYSDWMLGAPTLESGIAASSMAQDEWGHARLTYALLSDFGDEPKMLEHEREGGDYRSAEVLDRPLGSWSEMIAMGLLLDTALAVQYGALAESRYTPVHNRVQKLLDEERFHFQHAAGWTRRLAQVDAVRGEFRDALKRLLPAALRWFGQPEGSNERRLLEEEITSEGPDALRSRFLDTVAPVLESTDLARELGLTVRDGEWCYQSELDWSGWDSSRRRAGGEGPDAETIARVRGDKNRAFLMD